MRTIEIIIIVLDFLTLASLFWAQRPGWIAFLPVLSVIAVMAHLIIEKPRWQMAGLYLLTLILLALVLPRAFRDPAGSASPWAVVCGLLLLLVASLPPIAFPVPKLPDPTGPFGVGTHVFYWIDESRTEIYNDPPGGPRKIMVQVWYPANVAPGAQPGPYLGDLDKAGPALAKSLNLPPFVLSHIGLARTHSYPDVPTASAGQAFPVLVFSHGWTGFRAQNTYQMEELASHGYIVFSADHTYGAAVTVFPDGTVALNNRNALSPAGTPDAEYDRVANQLGETFVNDIRFIIGQAEKMNSGTIDSPLCGKLDLENVGVFGHSTGAGAAVETCSVDARCKAGLAEDAWLVPYSREMVVQGLKVPFMYLQSAGWSAKRNPPLFQSLFQNAQADEYRVRIQGSQHYDFSDVPLLTPLAAALKLKGPINGPRMLSITNAYTLAFFNHYLKGQPSSLLDGPSSQYPEVEFEKK